MAGTLHAKYYDSFNLLILQPIAILLNLTRRGVTFGESSICKLNIQMSVKVINSMSINSRNQYINWRMPSKCQPNRKRSLIFQIEIEKHGIENAKRGKSRSPDSPLSDGI